MSNNAIAVAANSPEQPLRRIRSFVLRQGRFTRRQQQAMEQYWLSMGIDYCTTPLDFVSVFGRKASLTLEIGFGMGASFVSMAQQQPERNFVGVEVHAPGVGACLARAHDLALSNLRVIHHDALDVLQQMIADQTLDQLLLFFPDPWHKARHNKRRIVQAEFVRLVWRKLKVGGVLHIATDWQPYAQHMLDVLTAQSGYRNLASEGEDYVPRPSWRPVTRFEQRGQQLGHGTWDLMFQKQAECDD